MENEENLDLLNLLKSLKEPITSLYDDNYMTLLHHAVLKGIDGKVELIIDLAKQDESYHRDLFHEWINHKTNGEGWTALHYASFQGNVDAIHALVKHEARAFEINNNGLNMLHVAAQGDVALPLYLFMKKGLNINSKDKRGSTPLHWACYSQSETAIAYLLAWNPDVNV